MDTIVFTNMEIFFDTNERPKLNVVLEKSSSDVILDISGNERRKCMLVLMPQDWANHGSMFYLESIHSVDNVGGFLEYYHAAKKDIIFLKNGKNELADQAPTIDDNIETYILQYMREH